MRTHFPEIKQKFGLWSALRAPQWPENTKKLSVSQSFRISNFRNHFQIFCFWGKVAARAEISNASPKVERTDHRQENMGSSRHLRLCGTSGPSANEIWNFALELSHKLIGPWKLCLTALGDFWDSVGLSAHSRRKRTLGKSIFKFCEYVCQSRGALLELGPQRISAEASAVFRKESVDVDINCCQNVENGHHVAKKKLWLFWSEIPKSSKNWAFTDFRNFLNMFRSQLFEELGSKAILSAQKSKWSQWMRLGWDRSYVIWPISGKFIFACHSEGDSVRGSELRPACSLKLYIFHSRFSCKRPNATKKIFNLSKGTFRTECGVSDRKLRERASNIVGEVGMCWGELVQKSLSWGKCLTRLRSPKRKCSEKNPKTLVKKEIISATNEIWKFEFKPKRSTNLMFSSSSDQMETKKIGVGIIHGKKSVLGEAKMKHENPRDFRGNFSKVLRCFPFAIRSV